MEGRTDSFKLYVANALQKIHFERTTLAVDENFTDKSKNIYHVKPVNNFLGKEISDGLFQVKKEEKENKEEETEAETLQNRWNTLKIRFALITKNGNTEFSKLSESKPEQELEPEKPVVNKKEQGKEVNFKGLEINSIS